MAMTRNADAVAPVRSSGPISIWLTRHASTSLASLGRLFRHPMSSLMIVLVIAVTLALPTAGDLEIFRAAWALYRAEAWAGRPVRLLGLGISAWGESGGAQQDLFASAAPPAQERLDRTLDDIGEKFGQGAVQRGMSRGGRPR